MRTRFNKGAASGGAEISFLIIAVIILFFTANLHIPNSGQHTGYVSSVEQSGIIWKTWTAYIKTDPQSSQEDSYCVTDPSVVDQLKSVATQRSSVTVYYSVPLMTWKWQCGGEQSIISGTSNFDPTTIGAIPVQPTGSPLSSVPDLVTADGSVNLPVTILPTSDGYSGEGMYADKYPSTFSVENATGFADQIAAYGAAYHVWIAPQGWTGLSGSGVDGNISVDLYPPGLGAYGGDVGVPNGGPHITYYEVPGCVGCMLDGAAQYFANAMQQYNSMYNSDGSNPITIPQGLKITPISSTLVTYTFPDENGLSIHGVAYYNPGVQNMQGAFYAEARFILPKAQADLSDFLSKIFINREEALMNQTK
jgi:hypothetical protein